MKDRMHYALSLAFNRFVRRMTGGKLSDYSYGFFAVRKDILAKQTFDRIFWGHGDYGIRFLFYAEKAGAKILEIPVVNGERRFGQPNRAYLRTFCRYLGEVIKLVINEQVKLAR